MVGGAQGTEQHLEGSPQREQGNQKVWLVMLGKGARAAGFVAGGECQVPCMVPWAFVGSCLRAEGPSWPAGVSDMSL